MKDIQVQLVTGEYTCDTGLTVTQWKAILHDPELINEDRLDMLVKFYDEPDHKSTCSAIAESEY